MTITINQANGEWARIAADTSSGVERLRVSGLYAVSAGFLSPAFTVSRAQAGGAQSTAIGPDGSLVQYYGADVPRFNGAARRLLIEGQRTNSALQSAGLSSPWFGREFGNVFATGITGPDGLTTAIQAQLFVSASLSSLVQTVSSSLLDHSLSVWLRNGKARLAFNTNTPISSDFIIGATPWTRNSFTANVNATEIVLFRPTTGPDQIVDTFGFQCEANAPFASTYIPTTTAALTRGRDVITAPLSGFGITGACTITGVAMIPQNAPTGVNQAIVSIDNGADADRYTLRNAAATGDLVFLRATGGAGSVTPAVGTMTAGTAFRYAIILDGAGNGSALVEGGSWQSVTGGPTGMTTLRLGSQTTAGAELFGELTNLQATPGALSQSAAAARMTATPLT